MVDFTDVQAAVDRIAGIVHRTPVMTSATLDRELGLRAFVKCENLQKCGAFKARGALNAVLALPEAAAARGVCTHSSGNHAAALAWAASRRGIRCVVVMPDSAPKVKVEAVRGYGAEVVFCKQTEREAVCARIQRETGAALVHPFENEQVIAGQGTVALEVIEQVPDLAAIIAPVGGGGLLSGIALVAGVLSPQTAVIGAEPAAVDDAARSLQSGVRAPRVVDPVTVADGLLTALGEPNFAILQSHHARIVTVAEDAIVAAARYFLERMKIVVEPSGATVLAALRAIAPEFRGRNVAVVPTGGNTDFRWLTG
jgi:threonine dehydratase